MIIRTTEMDAALLAALHELWPKGALFDVETVATRCVRHWLAAKGGGARYRPVGECLADDPLWQVLQFLRPRFEPRGKSYGWPKGPRDRFTDWLAANRGVEIAGLQLQREREGRYRVVKSGGGRR